MVAGVARAALAVSLIAMGAALTAPPPLRSTSARTTASVAPRRAGVTPVDEDLDFAAFTPPPVKDGDWVDAFCRATNGAMRDAVALTTPGLVRAIAVRSATDLTGGGDGPNRVLGRFPFATAKLTTPPEWPGVPRPVSLTVLASVPTALGWYGYYKFSVRAPPRAHARAPRCLAGVFARSRAPAGGAGERASERSFPSADPRRLSVTAAFIESGSNLGASPSSAFQVWL